MKIPANIAEQRIKVCMRHCETEIKRDLDGVMSTFVKNPYFLFNGIRFDGYDQVRKFYSEFLWAFDDLTVDDGVIYQADDAVCWEGAIRGVLVKGFLGIPVKEKKRVELPMSTVMKFNPTNTELVAEHVNADIHRLLVQLGLCEIPLKA